MADKQVISVSIGSSKRDHEVIVDLLGNSVRIWREGTDGDMDKAVARISELDGKVDAFGLGGIDLYLRAAGKDWYFREAKRFGEAAKLTPIVDGSGLKGAVEADVVRFMREDLGLDLSGKKVMTCCAVDRWGMAEAWWEAGCEQVCADMLYALGINIMLRKKSTTERFIKTLMPVVRRLPYAWLYDSAADHETPVDPDKHPELYRDADIIAGDYKYVRQWMPEDMEGKWVVTNTTTAEDMQFMRDRGVELLVTSTPRLEGRSFGTNVIEATMLAVSGASGPLLPEEYMKLLVETGFRPDVRWLQRDAAAAL